MHEKVRDIFYSGDPIYEKCTVITRIAPTFLRFGSFEIVKPTDSTTGRAGPSAGRKPILQALLNHTVNSYYPHLKQKYDGEQNEVKRYTEFFRGIIRYLPLLRPACSQRICRGGLFCCRDCEAHGRARGALAVRGLVPRRAQY
jgi:hypothetical protein